MSPATKYQDFLCRRDVDRYIALSVVIYSFYLVSASLVEKKGFAFFVLMLNLIVHNGLLLLRRRPYRVSLNPVAWLVAVSGANWHLWYGLLRNAPTMPLAPHWLTAGLALAGTILFLWARISLGRNFGIVPAQRSIITSGAYALVRHPIYTASITTSLAYLLGHYSMETLSIWLTGLGLLGLKTYNEEQFLKSDVRYQAYRERVRYLYFPEVV